MKSTTSKSNVVTQILFSAVAIVLGYLLLFKPSIQIVTLCQILCGGLVAVGVVSIVSFFLSSDYKRIDRYGFAIGTLLILSGCIGLIRMDNLTTNFEMYTGALSLVLGVLTLQGTVQMRVLDYAVWVLNLVITLACLAGAFCVLSGITVVTGLVNGFSNWLLLICGAASLLSLFVTWICILLAARREKKEQKEKEAEAAAPSHSADDDILPGEYEPIPAPQPEEKPAKPASAPAETSYGTPAKPSEPAEIHHSGFDPAEDISSDLPPAESPQLVFEPSEGHHTDFQPKE